MSLAAVYFTNIRSVFYLKNTYISCPLLCHLRYKKIKRRKPTYLPMAPSKLFRLPEHPFKEIPTDEKELFDNLVEEYNRKYDSMRKSIIEELKIKSQESQVKEVVESEKDFLLLLEENRKENERIKSIREEVVERKFQDEQLELLQRVELLKMEQQKKKERIEEIVKGIKGNRKFYLSQENLEAAIEEAIDNPVNVNFAISVNGEVLWEGTPPRELEERIMENLPQSTKM